MGPNTEIARAEWSEDCQVSQYCPEYPLVEVVLPENMQEVNNIILRTVSHDQGWCDLNSGSWTWVELVIVADSRPIERKAGHAWPFTRRFHVHHNEAGNAQFQEKATTFSLDSHNESIRSWLRSIRPGERIQVLPRAKFRRWVNFVREVVLEVSWTTTNGKASVSIGTPAGSSNPHAMPTYYPLDVNLQEIRLLEIQPGQLVDPLVCSLIYVSIDNPDNSIPYTALSYCWGSSEDKRTITLNVSEKAGPVGRQSRSLETQIQRNLYTALKHLRREQGPCRVVWADALCINQEDIEERSQQVALMRNIYTCAKDVCIWLGEGNEETPRIAKSLDTFIQAFEKDRSSFLENTSTNLAEPHGTTGITSEVYHLIGNMFNFDWYTRVWVLQEVFNARTATVQIGSVSLPWPLVTRIGLCLERAIERARNLGTFTMPRIFLSLFDVRLESNKLFATQRHIKDLLALLVASLDLDAADPRDKIFALMQFWEGVDVRSLSAEVRPDYKKTTLQVFADFTRWWIRTHQSLRILSAIHATSCRTWQRMSMEPSPELPNDRPSWSLWHTGSSTWTEGTLAYNMDCPYSASGSISSERQLLRLSSGRDDVLSLEGIRIGCIRDIRLFPWAKAQTSKFADLTEVFEKIFDPSGTLGTWTPGGTTSLPFNPDNHDQMIDHLIAHQEFVDTHDGAIPCISPCLFSGNRQSGEDLTGLCPYTARSGDIVVILVGGNVPYLLREQPAYATNQGQEVLYGFVGECFVQGYMDGQAASEWRDGKLRMETFELV